MSAVLDAHAPDNPRERFTTMSIATHGKSTVDNHARVVPGRPMNRVDDIDGAQPQMRHTRFGGDRRPDLFSTQDIAGAMPKHLHPQPRNKPCYNNSNTDIEGSQPHPYTFKTNRHLNPLEPEYSLSVNPSREPTPRDALRETLKVDDIAGTRPARYHKWKQRETMRVDDIAGAQAGWKPRHKRRQQPARQDKLDVSDITAKGFRTKRVTDPLNPTHTINGLTISDEPGMHPKGLPNAKNAPFYALTTHDIEGARPGWKPKHEMGGISEERRRHFRNINFVSDIEGTAAGSKVAGIRTKRVTNPNDPVYPLLDGAVHEVPATPPVDQRHLGDPRDTEVETLRREVETLRKDLEITRLQSEIARLKGSRPGTSASSRMSASRGRTADRMVLRSADGRPRVPGSPAASGGGAMPQGEGGIAPVSLPPRSERQLTPALLAAHAGASARRGTFGAGPPGDAASVASFASAASVRSVHSAYSYHSRATARSRASRAASRVSARRGPTPQQRREASQSVADLDAVQALPDRPPSALSRAGSQMFS